MCVIFMFKSRFLMFLCNYSKVWCKRRVILVRFIAHSGRSNGKCKTKKILKMFWYVQYSGTIFIIFKDKNNSWDCQLWNSFVLGHKLCKKKNMRIASNGNCIHIPSSEKMTSITFWKKKPLSFLVVNSHLTNLHSHQVYLCPSWKCEIWHFH